MLGSISGSGTIDVKNFYDKYETLTNENFAYAITSRTISFGNISSYSGGVAVPSLSYDASTGILSITNLSASTYVAGRDSYSISASANIYLYI